VAPYFLNELMVDKVNKAHSKMFGQSSTAMKTAYLDKVALWPLSGASLFTVQVRIICETCSTLSYTTKAIA
jgi:hypothetical protein